MSFFVKRIRRRKPSETSTPLNLGHPHFDGCINYWPITEIAGRTVIDAIGNNDGRILPKQFQPTPFAREYPWFKPEQAAFIEISPVTFANNVDFTFEAIVRINTAAAWISGNNLAANEYSRLGRFSEANLVIYNDANSSTNIGVVLTTGVEYHLVLARKQNSIRTYVNGALGNTVTVSGDITFRRLSSYGDATATSGVGTVDFQYLRLYDRALTAEEVRALANAPWAAFEKRAFIPVVGVPFISGTGDLQAQPASVEGVGITSAIEGVGDLQAQPASVFGLGAIVHDGAGDLQAQSATVSGMGEVGAVKVGTGDLQAAPASVFGLGDRASVGTGDLAAQPAAVAGVGSVEGLETGVGALQAADASVFGLGNIGHAGVGDLQAQSALVTGTGAIIGDLTLTPGDLAAIQDAVWAKLVNEGFVLKVEEVWQRRGLDIANPQTYDKAGGQIRVGGITIDVTGDANAVTQQRQ